VNMLEGNAFTCQSDHEQPETDPGQGKYSCGSQNLDDALLVWLAIGSFCLLFVLLLSSCSNSLMPLYEYLHHSLTAVNEINDLYSDLREMKTLTPADQDRGSGSSSRSTMPPLPPHIASNTSTSVESRLQLSQVIHLTSMHHLQSLSFRISLFYLLLVLPILCLLKLFTDAKGNYLYSTYSIQQTWYPTGIYLSGTLPAVIFLLSWVVVMLYSLWKIMRYHRLFCELFYPSRYRHQQHQQQHDDDDPLVRPTSIIRPSVWTSSSGSGGGSIGSSSEVILSDSESDSDNDGDGDDNSDPSSQGSQPVVHQQQQQQQQDQTTPSTSPQPSIQIHSRVFLSLLLVLVITLDIFLVFIINFSYLLLQESHTSSRNKLTGQLVLAIFKTIFSNAIIPAITSVMFGLLNYSRSVHLFIRTTSLLLNNLIIPAVVIALTSSSCFLNVFYSNDPINESYELSNSTALCDYQFTETGPSP
jgi:hypothetical protein